MPDIQSHPATEHEIVEITGPLDEAEISRIRILGASKIEVLDAVISRNARKWHDLDLRLPFSVKGKKVFEILVSNH